MVENVSCHASPNYMDHIAVKVNPARPVNGTWNHRWSHTYWNGIEEMKVKHFVYRSGLK